VVVFGLEAGDLFAAGCECCLRGVQSRCSPGKFDAKLFVPLAAFRIAAAVAGYDPYQNCAGEQNGDQRDPKCEKHA
jgi:hypothetical protein